MSDEFFPKDYLKIVKEVYDLMADEYDVFDPCTGPFFINSYRTCDHYIRKMLPHWANKMVLDVGCGTGLQTLQFAKAAMRVIGIDLSERLIEKAKTKAESLGLNNVYLIKADATCIPLEDNSVDYVSSYGDVIGHIPEYKKAIKEMTRVCRSGGIVTIEYDNKWHLGLMYSSKELLNAFRVRSEGDLRRWTYVYLRFPKKVDLIYKTFTYSEIKSLLKESGLELMKIVGIHIFSSIIPPRYHTPFNNTYLFHNFFTSLIINVGKIDFVLKEIYPFNRMGSSSILISRKK